MTMNHQDCCNKCRSFAHGDPVCECHKAPPEACCPKCRGIEKSPSGRGTSEVCYAHYEYCECHTPSVSSEWAEEFDKKFKHVYHPNIKAENVLQDTSEIKAFIASVEAEAEKRGSWDSWVRGLETGRVEGAAQRQLEIEGYIQGMKKKVTDCYHTPNDSCDTDCVQKGDNAAYNHALDDLLAKLQKK